ncbi:hypothetical protein SLNWT_5662 [Streptomyces albus]|uniref:Uncharacterized protein n=1 Tax=Streptomyces albus (strain ATCC 21838 / DSM 41398 / FERM P-419 / JCM 4703 / NBRC 107858) TaxID=1081613 RepID=A0A0B5ET80_STRA4|nr:hypothetical protein SLNWT_5662 [Streptomyces albus]
MTSTGCVAARGTRRPSKPGIPANPVPRPSASAHDTSFDESGESDAYVDDPDESDDFRAKRAHHG